MGVWLLHGAVAVVAFMFSAADALNPNVNGVGPTEKKEEELRMREADLATSATLIGAISFIMVLHWATNYPDKDIQENSWSAVTSTISIFCAVLIFQECHHLVERWITIPFFGEEITFHVFLVTFANLIFWILFALFSLMWYTHNLFSIMGGQAAALQHEGMKSDALDAKEVLGEEEEERKDDEPDIMVDWTAAKIDNIKDFTDLAHIQKKNTQVKCQSELLGHIVSFASINCFGTLQHLEFFRHSTLRLTMAVGIAAVTLTILWLCTWRIRYLMSHTRKFDSPGKNKLHKQHYVFWSDSVAEAENDVLALTMSFLIMQCIRFHITGGSLPSVEGEDEGSSLYDHDFGEKVSLLLVQCFAFFALFAVFAFQKSAGEAKKEEEQEAKKEPTLKHSLLTARSRRTESKMRDRLSDCVATGWAALFAWCLYFLSQMLLAGIPCFHLYPHIQGENMLLALVTSLFISIVGFVSTIGLDYVADNTYKWMGYVTKNSKNSSKYSEHVAKGFRSVMFAFGIAIGFSWEKLFDRSVESIAKMFTTTSIPFSDELLRLCLSIYCIVLLLPTRARHIKPYVLSRGWHYGYVTNIRELHSQAWHNLTEPKQLAVLNKIANFAKFIRAFVGEKNYEFDIEDASSSLRIQELTNQLQTYKEVFHRHMELMAPTLEHLREAVDSRLKPRSM